MVLFCSSCANQPMCFFMGSYGQTGDRPGAPFQPPVWGAEGDIEPPATPRGRVESWVPGRRAEGGRAAVAALRWGRGSESGERAESGVSSRDRSGVLSRPRDSPYCFSPPSHSAPRAAEFRRPWERVRRGGVTAELQTGRERGGRGEVPGLLRGFADTVAQTRARFVVGGRGERPAQRPALCSGTVERV